MWVAAKDQLVIESAAPYCSKLTTQKLRNTAMKKEKIHKCAKLAQNMLLFFIKRQARITFYKQCNTQKKLPSQADNKNTTKITNYKNHKF